METTLVYFFQVSIGAGILAAFYKFILSKTTFYSTNRFLLIGLLIISLGLPFVNISFAEVVGSVNVQPEHSAGAGESGIGTHATENLISSFSIEQVNESGTQLAFAILSFVYFAGVVFFCMRLVVSFVKIIQLIKGSVREKLDDRHILCVTPQNIEPFSWHRYIVMPANCCNDDATCIIRHEKAHLTYCHSIDLLLFNLYCVVFWFNPFSWMLKRELQLVHELQADAEVLQDHTDVKFYQLLLIRRKAGELKFAFAHNFKHNHLKRRIRMMVKKKSGPVQKWSYGLFLLALWVSLVAVSCTRKQLPENEVISGRVSGTFSNTSTNGRLELHTYAKKPDTFTNSAGKIIRIVAPGDSLLSQCQVVNGKFSFDYHFQDLHKVKLVFVDQENLAWKINFVNPHTSGMAKYIYTYCYFDANASLSVNIQSDTRSIRKIRIGPGESREMEASIQGSPAMNRMFELALK